MASDIERAVALLGAGELIGLPTETVYGLAADATNPQAVARIFAMKGRPLGHPLILHIGDATWLDRYCREVPETARALARAFWPGPLSMVLRRNEANVPSEVTGGLETVAVRVPAHPVAREVLFALGRPLAAPSANRFGGVSPTTREHVVHDLGDQLQLVLQGGPCDIGLESTIIDLSGTVPRLLRPGAVTRAQLERVLKNRVFDSDGLGAVAPGTLASHYSPRAQVEVFNTLADLQMRARQLTRDGHPVGLIVNEPFRGEGLPTGACVQHLAPGPSVLAHDLYAAMRRLDESGCAFILTRLPAPEGLGEAIRDRLRRAAAPKSS